MQEYSYRWMVRVQRDEKMQDIQINGDVLTVDEVGLHAYANKDHLRLVFIPLQNIVNVQVMNFDGYANGFEVLGTVK
jgi:hypothetical protein